MVFPIGLGGLRAAVLGDRSCREFAASGYVRMVDGNRSAFNWLSLAYIHDQRVRRSSVRREHRCLLALCRSARDFLGALCIARAKYRYRPALDLPSAVLGGLGISLSALVPLVYRQF